MMITHATLTINSKQYNILNFCYKFQRDIDAKGRPRSVYYGGEILVQMESTDDSELFRQTVDKKTTSVSGSIETFSGDDTCVRRIDFEKAYLCALGEEIQSDSSLPMTTSLSISPMRLDFNNTLRLDRRWPEAPHGWQKYEAKEEKYASSGTKEEKQVVEIYWTYGKDKIRLDSKSRHYTDVNLHVKTKGYKEGDNVSVLIKRSDSKEVTNNASVIQVKGQVDANGEMSVENVLKEYKLNL